MFLETRGWWDCVIYKTPAIPFFIFMRRASRWTRAASTTPGNWEDGYNILLSSFIQSRTPRLGIRGIYILLLKTRDTSACPQYKRMVIEHKFSNSLGSRAYVMGYELSCLTNFRIHAILWVSVPSFCSSRTKKGMLILVIYRVSSCLGANFSLGNIKCLPSY